ncbi:MAG: hypothetical protein KC561_16950, partial [Myxococcales bacterium]|nr:hypothetical protein [Myxococcales bacterium]
LREFPAYRYRNGRYDLACPAGWERRVNHGPVPSRRERLEALLLTMLRIRAFEDAAERASQGGVAAFGQTLGSRAAVRGPLHLSTGQEAVAAGVCAALRRDDLLTSTHRGHGHTIAKGGDLGRMMAELHGRAAGCNGGKGGSMHIADFSVGMLGANGIVGGGCRSRSAPRRPSGCSGAAGSWLVSSAMARSTAGRSSSRSTGPRCTGCPCCSSARTTAGRRPPRPAP